MKKILLVDDSETDRTILRRFLTRVPGETLELVEATNLAEAEAAFKAHQPDCTLVDYNLPDGTGLELLARLQQLRPPDGLCLVMITGSGSVQLAVQALNNGALDYLTKGQFDQELLLKVVRHAIERNEWRQYQSRYHQQLQRVNQELRYSLAELNKTRQELDAANQHLRTANAEVEARNRALDAANRQLARTNQDLDNFVYAASHDLKQPIHNLRGLFEERGRLCQCENRDLDEIRRLADASLTTLLTTVEDLSVVVDASRQPSQDVREKVKLADLAAEVQQTLRAQLKQTGGKFIFDFSGLPTVVYSRGHLRTILTNLLSNALRYHQPGRPPVVEVRSWCNEHSNPMVSVKDNGRGLDLDRYQADLFQLFRRFHPDGPEGTGVGLFLVNRLVTSCGGALRVESTVGEGATFEVRLTDSAVCDETL